MLCFGFFCTLKKKEKINQRGHYDNAIGVENVGNTALELHSMCKTIIFDRYCDFSIQE